MKLLSKTDFRGQTVQLPDWLVSQYGEWRKIIENRDFPCYFGTQAEKLGDLRYCYMEKLDSAGLANVLRQFLDLSKKQPDHRHALVLFIKPEQEERSFDFYRERFWQLLNNLHQLDETPWPEDFPKDPENAHWEFVFGGEQMFVSGAMPAYKNRVSRNVGDSQVLIFQPRRIFADIVQCPKTGKKTVETIRKRAEQFEGIPVHPDLGSFGTEQLEWKQYIISDDMEPETGECPFRFK